MARRRFILGTAGHVDHGKTQLVIRLTGHDTDRLKEEKERGISIELGFAPLPLGPDTMIGVVDVPGHEKFVKHMVAGAGGIDLAMLLVAADEGVMPQTKEHLEVLRSLHIAAGVVVISKVDAVTADMLPLVREEIAELVEGTFLESAPVIETSAKTGAGIEALKATLLELTRGIEERDRTGPFRLAVDRVFHVQGIGVVVTGSGYSGTVKVGDSLDLLPSKKTVRVREIQSFGEKREEGYAGERLAIALQGVKLDDVSRGEMLVTPSTFAATILLDARLHVARYAALELRHRERVRVHHGAREVLGRVALLEADELRTGGSGFAQLHLESPIVAAEGDYLIIRKYSPTRVLGSGRILDTRARRHRRRDPAVLENLKLRETGSPAERVLQAVEAAGLKGQSESGLDPDALRSLADEGAVAVIDGVAFSRRVIGRLADRAVSLASEYVEAHPLRYGIDKEELRQKLAFPHGPSLFNSVLERLSRTSPLFVRENRVRAGSAEITPPPGLAGEIARLEDIIRRAGLAFPRHGEIVSQWGGSGDLAEALLFLRDTGKVIRIGGDGYLHRQALAGCVEALRGWFEGHPELAVGDLKELFGVTRKHAIPLLEYTDEKKITVRQGNSRRRGPALSRPEAPGGELSPPESPGGKGA